MNDIENVVMKWLEARDNGWVWFFGGQKLTKEETIKKFKKDKNFRKLVVEQVTKVAVEMFESHLRKEGKL